MPRSESQQKPRTSGLGACLAGRAPESCLRYHWQTKIWSLPNKHCLWQTKIWSLQNNAQTLQGLPLAMPKKNELTVEHQWRRGNETHCNRPPPSTKRERSTALEKLVQLQRQPMLPGHRQDWKNQYTTADITSMYMNLTEAHSTVKNPHCRMAQLETLRHVCSTRLEGRSLISFIETRSTTKLFKVHLWQCQKHAN